MEPAGYNGVQLQQQHACHWVSLVADGGQCLAVVPHGFLSCQDEGCEGGPRLGHLQERMLPNNSVVNVTKETCCGISTSLL